MLPIHVIGGEDGTGRRDRHGHPLARAGWYATRAGVVAVVTALPLSIVTFALVLADAPTLAAGLETAVSATTGPLGPPGGVPWLLHVGVLGLLGGSWLVGLGLVLTGVFDGGA